MTRDQPGVAGRPCTAAQVVAAAIFVLIEFSLVIIPFTFTFLELRPEATKALLEHSQDWPLSHARQLMATIALLLGTRTAGSGLVRLT